MNKSKVLVFTSYDKWSNNIAESIQDSLPGWEDSYPSNSEERHIKKWVFENGSHRLAPVNMAEFVEDEGVFLVYDEINTCAPEAFETLKVQCKGDNLFVLTHSNGCQYQDLVSLTPVCCLSGAHNTNAKDNYHAVFEILADKNDDKLSRIINKVFKPMTKLEMVLRFLHGCLAPRNNTGDFEYIRNRLTNEFQDEEKRLLEEFDLKYRAAETLQDYYEDLVVLRDELLKNALKYQ